MRFCSSRELIELADALALVLQRSIELVASLCFGAFLLLRFGNRWALLTTMRTHRHFGLFSTRNARSSCASLLRVRSSPLHRVQLLGWCCLALLFQARLVEVVVVITRIGRDPFRRDLDDAIRHRADEMAIMRDEHDSAFELLGRLLEDISAGDIEMVGRFVQAEQRA